MKNYLIVSCFLISGGMASAVVQMASYQDKPAYLYVDNYCESSTESTVDSSSPPMLPPAFEDNWQSSDSINWANGTAGNYTFTWQYIYKWSHYTYVQNYYLAISWPQAIWPNVLGSQSTNIGIFTETEWPSDDYTNYSTGGVPIMQEHSDMSVPLLDNSVNVLGYVRNATGSRTAQATMKLRAGGKSIPNLRGYFNLSTSATSYLYQQIPSIWGNYIWFDDDNAACFGDFGGAWNGINVPSQNISIGSEGQADANGNILVSCPPGGDVDVTPYVAGAKWYTYSMSVTPTIVLYFSIDPNFRPQTYFDANQVQSTMQTELSRLVFNPNGQSVTVKVNVEQTPSSKQGWNSNKSYYLNRVDWTALTGIPSDRDYKGLIDVSEESIEQWAVANSVIPNAQTYANIFAHEGVWGNAGGNHDCIFNCTDGDISAGGTFSAVYLRTAFGVTLQSQEKLISEF